MAEPKHLPLFIVKLGGSLAGSSALAAWIDALDACRAALVIVPGGGGFAETVRVMQTKMGFADAAAHHMALLAMQQYALALAAIWPRLVCAQTPAAIRDALQRGQVPCWAPERMAIKAPLPKSWDVTSDTLAAWLAAELNADELILIKSVDAGGEASLTDLAEAGIVDPLFPDFAVASNAKVFLAGPAALAEAPHLLRQGVAPGRKICLA